LVIYNYGDCKRRRGRTHLSGRPKMLPLGSPSASGKMFRKGWRKTMFWRGIQMV